ncbi:unnamed protein product [Knipowitschia caucasica]|uniref:C1q domain-containing protein n=1 Tax=Knipowitschia caucasica TaxID=637954 RepID=A0AAV2J4K0_KNICA
MNVLSFSAAVTLCVVGLTLAQNNDPPSFWSFLNFQWNADGDKSTSGFLNSKDTGGNGGGNVESNNVCVADQAACGCCLMHQQIDRMKKSFNYSLSLMENQLTQAVNALSQFRSARSAVSVALFTDNTQKCYGPFRDDTLVKYKHIFLDLGNHYDASKGVYTVPITGVYSLSVTVYSNAGAPGNTLAACATLQVNGRSLISLREKNQQDPEDSATVFVAHLLNKGDTVSVNLPIGCFLCDDNHHFNTLSVFLLYITNV